ncbi:hypothetical protein GO730_00435 [Spirosoma sp. HMF3257]|uniref:DUF1834 family protein n=1 Tax=Spirosoma telluris TaxID=2183553 RepID=A0A327NDC2_9BACT|nr:hypothetical protein [Spirosoma telluris]RAI73271.1 hypothetical protein HMF3257_00425 [Spirosoma telluris]
MKITDLLSLDDFIRSVVEAMPGIDYYLPLSNGEKAVDEISGYYTNDYQGTTAFLQVAEAMRKNDLITFQCSLTIATKPANVSARAGLEARNLTLKLIMDLLGRLDLAADAAIQSVEDQSDMYDLVIEPVDRIFPIGMLANVNLEGHYVDLDVTVPATHLLFPA